MHVVSMHASVYWSQLVPILVLPCIASACSLSGIVRPGISTCGDGSIDLGEACDDNNAHDGDSCSGSCAATDPDHDDDGFAASVDCDDEDAAIHPGAVDRCGDGVDADCSGTDATCSACSQGPVPQAGCACGATAVDTGYCCDGSASATSCTSQGTWPIASDPGAQRVYFEDYEDGSCDRIKSGSSAAVVSAADGADVFAGAYCLRGNLDPNTVDPITHKQGTTRYAALNDVGVKPLGVTDRLYVAFWMRWDQGVSWTNINGNSSGVKVIFLHGTANWGSGVDVNYVTGQPYGPRSWWIVNNNNSGPAFGVTEGTSAADGATGVWHHIEA
jgi:cysteine-rich repeat protein